MFHLLHLPFSLCSKLISVVKHVVQWCAKYTLNIRAYTKASFSWYIVWKTKLLKLCSSLCYLFKHIRFLRPNFLPTISITTSFSFFLQTHGRNIVHLTLRFHIKNTLHPNKEKNPKNLSQQKIRIIADLFKGVACVALIFITFYIPNH